MFGDRMKWLIKLIIYLIVLFILYIIAAVMLAVDNFVLNMIAIVILFGSVIWIYYKILVSKYFWFIGIPVCIIMIMLNPIVGIIFTLALHYLREWLIKRKNKSKNL